MQGIRDCVSFSCLDSCSVFFYSKLKCYVCMCVCVCVQRKEEREEEIKGRREREGKKEILCVPYE